MGTDELVNRLRQTWQDEAVEKVLFDLWGRAAEIQGTYPGDEAFSRLFRRIDEAWIKAKIACEKASAATTESKVD